MIKSMTGYGQGTINHEGLSISAQIKSLNHRYLDIFVRLPRGFDRLEIDIKRYLRRAISRGRLEVTISLEPTNADVQFMDVDYSLAKEYYRCLQSLSETLGLEDSVSLQDILRFGDIIKMKECLSDEQIKSLSESVLDIAIEKLQDMRIQEGSLICQDIHTRLESIAEHLRVITQRIPVALDAYRSYLNERLKEVFQVELPEERLAQEMVLHAEKSDVTEETVRLNIHLQQMMNFLNHNGPVGRKMDFLIQELYREVNTLGAKALDMPITERVVEIKSELERIREQVQNLE